MEDVEQYDQYFDYDIDVAYEPAYIGKYDGWIGVILLGSIIFGPMAVISTVLPPIRFADFVIIFLAMARWGRARRLYGGFLFSSHNRRFSILMLVITFVLFFSTLLNAVTGRNPFSFRDFNFSIVFIRMVVIAGISSSLIFQERQIRQFAKGVLLISLVSILLAFVQRFRPYLLSSFLERFYAMDWRRIEEQSPGVAFRVVGTFGNPNLFSSALVMLSGACLAIAINMKGLFKFLSIVMFFGMSLAMLIATGSRTGLLAFAAIVSVAMLLSLKGRARLSVVFAMILIFCAFMFVRANIEKLPINPRVKNIISSGEYASAESFRARYYYWTRGLREARRSILFGVGGSKMAEQLTDNGYIMVLVRTGIIGLVTYLSMLIYLLTRGVKSIYIEQRPLFKALILTSILVLINHLVFELTADFFWSVKYGAMFALFMGLLCSLSYQVLHDNCYYEEHNEYNYDISESEIAL